MLLLYKALFSLVIALPSWFGLLSLGHEIQVRIPVWNVGNIFFDLVKGHSTTTRQPTRPPTRSTRPTRYTTSTKPPTRPTDPTDDICAVYPHLPACQEEVTPEPSICDTFPQLPLCQEETNSPGPSICDTYPQLPLCQEETNPPGPSICDTYPQLPLCQEESVRNSQVSGVASLRWVRDSNFCLYYPNSCSNAEESPFLPLVDRQLLRGKRVPTSEWLGPTRRPAWQRQSKKNTLQSNQNK